MSAGPLLQAIAAVTHVHVSLRRPLLPASCRPLCGRSLGAMQLQSPVTHLALSSAFSPSPAASLGAGQINVYNGCFPNFASAAGARPTCRLPCCPPGGRCGFLGFARTRPCLLHVCILC